MTGIYNRNIYVEYIYNKLSENFFLTLAEEDQIVIQVFKRKNIRINKNLLRVNQEKVNHYMWKKPQQGESFNHMTHLSIEQEELVIPQQEMSAIAFYVI